MTTRLLCLGCSHKTALVEMRERLVFDPAQCRLALEQLHEAYSDCEAMILSTCNRMELYVLRGLHARPREDDLRDFLSKFHHLPRELYEGSLYGLADEQAVRQIFSVAAGLDSLVPGEDQILAQVKSALAIAQKAGSAGAGLTELLDFAFNVAKHVRSETPLGVGRVSIASVAADLAASTFGELAGKTVLSVGAGKMNSLMLRRLKRLGAGKVLVANRSPQRAAELAGQCGGEVLPWQDLCQALPQADLVICSTGSSEPVLSAAKVAKALAGRPPGKGLLIIDIAMPRDVEEGVGKLAGVTLYNIDDLKAVVEKSLTARLAGLEPARQIVQRHVQEYFHRLHVREVAPVVENLYQLMRDAADKEIQQVISRLDGDPQASGKLIRQAIHRALRQVLHRPIIHLRDEAGSQSARQQADILRRLFDLDQTDQSSQTKDSQ
jgi:glutamyl-tRNA reductase